MNDEARILKALSLVGYLGMMSGLLALLWLHSLFSSSPIVIALQISALLLFFWARITFGRRSFHLAANPTEGGLVDTGPYRYIRHPIYAALCLFTGAGAAAHLSWKTEFAFGLILGFALLRIFVRSHSSQNVIRSTRNMLAGHGGWFQAFSSAWLRTRAIHESPREGTRPTG